MDHSLHYCFGQAGISLRIGRFYTDDTIYLVWSDFHPTLTLTPQDHDELVQGSILLDFLSLLDFKRLS